MARNIGPVQAGSGRDIGPVQTSAAAVGVSITPALDTIAIAGEAVSLSAPIAIPAPDTDTISIAGEDVTVAIHKSIFAIGAGSISITGEAVSILTPGEADSLPSLWMTYLAGEGFTSDGFNTRLYDAFASKASVTTELGMADVIHAYYDLQSISTGTVQDRTLTFLDTNYPSLTGSLTDKLVQTLKDGNFFV